MEEKGNTNQNVKNQSNGHFYGIKTVEQPRGVAQIKKLWYPGTTIDIKFLNGSQEFHQKVKTYAAEWEQYADITFNFIESGDADVRITFDSNNSRYVTWSTIGTDCKMITNQSEPTMNFVDWNYLYEEEIKGDVLRAFGQVLGLELEHRHIDFDAGWRDNISLYWEGSIEDIPWDELKKYVFDPLESSKVLQTDEYDEESIMIWPFPRQFALNTARDYNFELSEKDKEFILSVYPKKSFQETPIFTAKVKLLVEFQINNNMDITEFLIDWGDGVTEPYSYFLEEDWEIWHGYSDESIYTLKVYGDENEVKTLFFGGNAIEVDFSGNKQLETLLLRGDFEPLDLSGIISLKNLTCDYSTIPTFNLSGNINLERIYLNNCSITSLDLSNNPNVKYVNLANSSLLRNGGDELLNFVISLPHRSEEDRGTLVVGYLSEENRDIMEILESKNWDY